MQKVTRRSFIVGASAGAAGVALGAGVPALVNELSSKPANSLQGPLMAYVLDASKGDVVLLVGDKKTTVHNPDLVRRLVNAAQ